MPGQVKLYHIIFWGLGLAFFNVILAQGLRQFFLWLEVVDAPHEDRLSRHKKPMPLCGGTLLAINLVLFWLFAYLFGLRETWIDYLAVNALLFYAVGLLDDVVLKKRQHNYPWTKLFLQLLASGVVYGLVVTNTPVTPGQGTIIFVLLPGTINAFNLIDGLNGLAGGLAFINLLFFSTLMYAYDHSFAVFVVLFVPLAVFQRFNLYRNSMFLGDSGSYLLGALVAGFAFLAYRDHFLAVQFPLDWILTGLLVGLPALDLTRVVLIRLARRKNPLRGDLAHLHHFLIRRFEHKNVLVICFFLHIFWLSGLFALLYWLGLISLFG